jgi:hypothetical protein
MAIPDGAIPLALGTLLAVGAAALVLGPLLADDAGPTRAPAAPRRAPANEAEPGAVAALREIEFDRATGKLSDSDYSALKATYTRQALAELRTADAAPDVDDDPVEAVIREYQRRQGGCSVCHHPPEPDAVYCSACGHFLADACGTCGAAADIPGQKFCSGCGASLS